MCARGISFWASLYLAVVLLLGGAGLRYPVLEGIEEIGAIGLIGLCLMRPSPPLPHLGRAMIALWLFCLAVAAAQLLPLPPAIWTALPGRELASQISRSIGQAAVWRPTTLLPERTVQALLALLPPGAMLLATLRLPTEERWRLVRVIVGFGVIGVVLGAVQFASGSGDGATPFTTDHQGNAVGLFVNRNHQATFLLVAMLFGAALGARAAQRAGWTARLLALAYLALLALGVVATTSRMGTALLPVAALFALLLLFGDRLSWKGALAGSLVTAALVYSALQSGTVQHTLGRFSAVEDERTSFWQDSVQAIRRSFPVGTGMGGFQPAHQAVERLDHVGPDVPNNAHDDYLELVMDAGLPAVIGLIAALAILIAAGRRLVRQGGRTDEQLLGAAGLCGIVIALLHSTVDYPLRMTAIASLFACCAALSCASPIAVDEQRRQEGALLRVWRPALLVAAGFVTMLGSIATATSGHLQQQGAFFEAHRWAPWTSASTSQLATNEFLAGRKTEATQLALRALASSPIDVAALRALALAEEANAPNRTLAHMRMAGALGWRDRLTQYWLMEHGFETGDLGLAAARTDALLRQNVLTDQLFAMLHQAVHDPAVARAVADRLVIQPGWARPYLTQVDQLTPDQLVDHGRVLAMIAPRSPQAARDGAARTAAKLVEGNKLAEAFALWRPFARRTTVQDGEFDDLSAARDDGPFGWRTSTPVATRVAAEMPDRPIVGAALHLHSDGVATGVVLSQLVSLAPGRWVLRYASAGSSLGTDPPFEWRIACHGEAASAALSDLGHTAGPDLWVRWRRAIDSLPGGCRFQDLQLWSTATSSSDSWIDGVIIERRR